MKTAPTSVPAIIEHLNPVMEHFGPLSQDTGKMPIPDTVRDIPSFVYHMLTASEQKICDTATD